MTAAKTTAKPAKTPKPANKPADEATQAPAAAATIDPAVQADQAAQAPALDTPTDTAPNGPTADYVYVEGLTLDENGDVVGADGVALPPVAMHDDGTVLVLHALLLAGSPAVQSLQHGAVLEGLSRAEADVLAERARQLAAKGYDSAYDSQFQNGELAQAAACYALFASGRQAPRSVFMWPFQTEAFRPHDKRRAMVKGAALLLAAIEAHDLAEAGE